MFCTAISRKPAATRAGPRVSPVAAAIRPASSANFRSVARTSSGWSPAGPKTRGKYAGWTRPSKALASVTVSGPPWP